jgi:hypothetical protein
LGVIIVTIPESLEEWRCIACDSVAPMW